MKIVIQRVSNAKVSIDSIEKATINQGLLILVGIENNDNNEDINWLANKIVNLRIFPDENGQMNLSIKNSNGDIIIVSQFTLQASTKKGNRPSYLNAAKPDIAIPIYKSFIAKVEELLEKKIQTGEFGANMEVTLLNDGPVTILIDSKNRA